MSFIQSEWRNASDVYSMIEQYILFIIVINTFQMIEIRLNFRRRNVIYIFLMITTHIYIYITTESWQGDIFLIIFYKHKLKHIVIINFETNKFGLNKDISFLSKYDSFKY